LQWALPSLAAACWAGTALPDIRLQVEPMETAVAKAGGTRMRAIDDDTEVKEAVLRKLHRWGPLPESDVSRMLWQYYLVTDDFRDMEEEGLIDLAFAGDEYIISMSLLGRLWLEQRDQQEVQ